MEPAFPEARPIGPGARIALVAPSGPFDLALFERGVERLRTRYEVTFDEGIVEKRGYLAGSDARRLAELLAAYDDDSVDAIVCARGGYGATRLLPELPIERVARARKLLVGFSDITALHALHARARVPSLHATMAASLGKADDEAFAQWVAALEQGATWPPLARGTWGRGSSEGVLVGGNLAVLASLVGTPFELPVEGRILFLEDVGERPYRLDRMLTQLRHAGWFSRVAGVALGDFTDCTPGPDGRTADEVLEEHLSDLPVPVVVGVAAGHGASNVALPFGRRVAISATKLSA